jgi:integral membrane protein
VLRAIPRTAYATVSQASTPRKRGSTAVVFIGASHGAVFTLYMLLVPLVVRARHWFFKTTGTASCVVFVPLLPWAFERTIRREIAD